MKKSPHEIERRTRGRGTVEVGNQSFSDFVLHGNGNDIIQGEAGSRIRRQTRAAIINSGKAENDAAIHAWRVAA